MSSQPSHLSDAIYKTCTLDLLKLSDSFVHVHLKAPLLNRCICFPPNAQSRTWINAVCFHLLYWVTLSDFPSASYRWDVFRGQLLLLSIPSCLLFFINVHSITHYTDLGVKLNRDSDWLLNQQYKTISLNIAQTIFTSHLQKFSSPASHRSRSHNPLYRSLHRKWMEYGAMGITGIWATTLLICFSEDRA